MIYLRNVLSNLIQNSNTTPKKVDQVEQGRTEKVKIYLLEQGNKALQFGKEHKTTLLTIGLGVSVLAIGYYFRSDLTKHFTKRVAEQGASLTEKVKMPVAQAITASNKGALPTIARKVSNIPNPFAEVCSLSESPSMYETCTAAFRYPLKCVQESLHDYKCVELVENQNKTCSWSCINIVKDRVLSLPDKTKSFLLRCCEEKDVGFLKCEEKGIPSNLFACGDSSCLLREKLRRLHRSMLSFNN